MILLMNNNDDEYPSTEKNYDDYNYAEIYYFDENDNDF